jgi:LmbE family N-acetylglucosaminyl deacetylase
MMNVTIIVAHADDEVIGCAGLIHNEARKHFSPHDRVTVLFTCKEHDKARRKEVEEAQKVLGHYVDWLDCFEDNHADGVPFDSIVKKIERGIDRTADKTEHYPFLVVTHHIADLYPDHQITAQAALNATRKADRVLMCQPIWNSSRPHNPQITVFAPLEVKQRAMDCYKSQNQTLPLRESYEVVRWTL